ncbi:MAG TPA: elongation factor P hydroxylase [Stellaceae bacterium]|nr:elongation factor P hydroxylase [Stellaceae bacterium]
MIIAGDFGISARHAQFPAAAGAPMILTPIPPDELVAALDRFAEGLTDAAARAAFAQIRATSPDRAEGGAAEDDRRAAIAWARACGVPVHPDGTDCAFNWDGTALDPGTEAYVILHEVAHFLIAPPERRSLPDFGLGPGPDTRDRDAASEAATLTLAESEADEAAASLIGILWEADLGQPALASFLDQNWLEGLGRSAAPHFERVVAQLAAYGDLPSPSHRFATDPSSPAMRASGKLDRGRPARIF